MHWQSLKAGQALDYGFHIHIYLLLRNLCRTTDHAFPAIFHANCGHLYGIMPNERMFRFTKSYMEHEIVRGIKETGVKRIRIHDLRHSHASLLVELGFQPLAIAERLGHEKIETTLNTYSHLYPNKQAELADRLELENEEDNL